MNLKNGIFRRMIIDLMNVILGINDDDYEPDKREIRHFLIYLFLILIVTLLAITLSST